VYFSYDPPKGFTARRGHGVPWRCLTLEKTIELIQSRDEMGTLELRGDDRPYNMLEFQV